MTPCYGRGGAREYLGNVVRAKPYVLNGIINFS